MTLTGRAKKSRKRRIFLDSSVLIAAAISLTGAGREIINQGFTNKLDLYISPDVLEETKRNLTLKAPQALNYFYKFQRSLVAKSVQPTLTQIIKAAKIIEAKDAPIVAGAIQAKVDFLVSFDRKHLLLRKKEIEMEFNIKVSTPDKVIKLKDQQ